MNESNPYKDQSNAKGFRLEHWHKIMLILMVYDFLAVNLSYIVALWLRFDCKYSSIVPKYIIAWRKFIPIYSVFCIAVFILLKLYRSVWRFASYDELYRIIEASLITAVFHIAAITLLLQRMPISYYVIGAVLQFILILGIRFSYRFILLITSGDKQNKAASPEKRVMLIGAGAAGQMILRDVQRATKDKVCCIIDDNPNKWKRYIDGIPIVGGRDDILSSVEKYKIDKIYFAIPTATPEQRRDIINICNESSCEIKQLPGMYQIATGELSVSNLKEVSVEDLLGREPVRADLTEVFQFINGKVVLVTGGGGSIGSELCRQIASHKPKKLIIFDIYENNAYDIQLELREKYPGLDLVT